MKHRTDKEMLFYFLESRNFNQDSGKLAFDMGYDLGDYAGNKHFYTIARECAQLLRTRLQGVFDENNNFAAERAVDEFGQFHDDPEK